KIGAKSKEKTLLGLFNVYAPKEDGNNPRGYAEFVAGKLGMKIDEPFKAFDSKGRIWDDTLLKKTVIAMVSMEIMNGWHIPETDLLNAVLLYEHDFGAI